MKEKFKEKLAEVNKKDKYTIFDVVFRSIKRLFYIVIWWMSISIILLGIADVNLASAMHLAIGSRLLVLTGIVFIVELLAFGSWKVAKRAGIARQIEKEESKDE